MKRLSFWVLKILLWANTAYAAIAYEWHIGVIVMMAVSFALLLQTLFPARFAALFHPQRHKAGRVVWAILAGGFALLFLFVAISGYVNDIRNDEKAILVLGTTVLGHDVSNVLEHRLEKALQVYQHNTSPALLVVSGGIANDEEEIPEAQAMFLWLVERGVPKEGILLEQQSLTTQENMVYSMQLLQSKGISADAPIGIITNAFHCYRTNHYARQAGFTYAYTIPAGISLPTILPMYIREVFAVLYMWIVE